jgi:hypothetical protein
MKNQRDWDEESDSHCKRSKESRDEDLNEVHHRDLSENHRLKRKLL